MHVLAVDISASEPQADFGELQGIRLQWAPRMTTEEILRAAAEMLDRQNRCGTAEERLRHAYSAGPPARQQFDLGLVKRDGVWEMPR